MEKDLECCVVLDYSTFYKYWTFLKRNYSDKTHNDNDSKFYFSCFKETKQDDFINAIKNVLKYCSYFPRIDEIQRYLPKEKIDSVNGTKTNSEVLSILDYDWLNAEEGNSENNK